MSVITISRGSYSWGKEVAEKVAQELGYECIGREVLLEASKEFDVPEIKLVRAIEDTPSIFDRFTYGKEKYISYIRTVILKHLRKDNVVYHGLAGHFFVRDISHVLKVRIIANLENRVRLVMERDGVTSKEALRFIKKIDQQRRKWSRQLYGIDTWDPSLYDLVIHIEKVWVSDAVDIIVHTVGLRHFQPTPESQRAMDDLVIAAEAKAAIVDLEPGVKVSAKNGVVYVKARVHESREKKLADEMMKAVANIQGIRDLKLELIPPILFGDG